MKRVWKTTITGLGLALGILVSGGTAEAAWVSVNNIDQTRFNDASGTDYWDSHSDDGSQLNVGYYLTKSGGFTSTGLTPPIGTYDSNGNYLSGAHLQYNDLDGLGGLLFTAGNGSVATGTVTFLLEVAGNNPYNEVWISSTANGGTPIQVFAGGDSPPAGPVSLNANNPFALILLDTHYKRGWYSTGEYFEYTGDDATWYLTATVKGGDTNFAVFKSSDDALAQDLYVGIEDNDNRSGPPDQPTDRDFNDIVLHIHSDTGGGVIPTPAPPAVLLALAGILPCLALRRRLAAKTA
jgi:hypothetical protein